MPMTRAPELRRTTDTPEWERLLVAAEQIFKIGGWLKALAMALVGMGVWVAWQTFTVQDIQARMHSLELDRATSTVEWRRWREDINARMAETQTDVKWIRASLAGKITK